MCLADWQVHSVLCATPDEQMAKVKDLQFWNVNDNHTNRRTVSFSRTFTWKLSGLCKLSPDPYKLLQSYWVYNTFKAQLPQSCPCTFIYMLSCATVYVEIDNSTASCLDAVGQPRKLHTCAGSFQSKVDVSVLSCAWSQSKNWMGMTIWKKLAGLAHFAHLKCAYQRYTCIKHTKITLNIEQSTDDTLNWQTNKRSMHRHLKCNQIC